MSLTRRHLLAMGGGLALWPFTMQAAQVAEQAAEATENEPRDVTALFNRIRREHGLGLMIADKKLESVAKNQAYLMAKKGKLSHTTSWGQGFKSRLSKAGVRGAAAENIAAGQKNVNLVFTAWMRSPNHRRNMLDRRFSRYGLAYAISPARADYRYWVIVLGR